MTLTQLLAALTTTPTAAWQGLAPPAFNSQGVQPVSLGGQGRPDPIMIEQAKTRGRRKKTNPFGGGVQAAIQRHITELPTFENVKSTGTGYWYDDPMTGVRMYGGGPEMATPQAERRHYRGLSG